MTLLRSAARTLLASYFVLSGVKALKEPEKLAPLAQPAADKLVPLVKEYAPNQVLDFVPEDATTLVRINGAAQVLGGLALATGIGRRLGAVLLAATLIPSTIAKYPFWTRQDPEERARDRSHFLKNASLLGGVLLAAQDTEGKPSIAYRAQKGSAAVSRDTKKAGKQLAKKAGKLADSAGGSLDDALVEGAALLGGAVAATRASRRRAAKQLEQAAEAAAKQAAVTKKAAAKQAAETKKAAVKQAAEAKELAEKQAIEAKKATAKAAKEAKKKGKKALDSAQQGASALSRNITLGDN